LSSLRDAEELVGDPYLFYTDAGDYYYSNQSWLLASGMYLKSFDYGPKPQAELLDRVHQSLYLSARGVGTLTLFEISSAKYIKPEMLEIVSARRSLYKGETQAAQEIVVKLNRGGSELLELDLIEAEIYIKIGEPEAARENLEALVENKNAPTWIRELAKIYLERNP